MKKKDIPLDRFWLVLLLGCAGGAVLVMGSWAFYMNILLLGLTASSCYEVHMALILFSQCITN